MNGLTEIQRMNMKAEQKAKYKNWLLTGKKVQLEAHCVEWECPACGRSHITELGELTRTGRTFAVKCFSCERSFEAEL